MKNYKQDPLQEAIEDEHTRLAHAIDQGAEIYLETSFGAYRVLTVHHFDVISVPKDSSTKGGERTWMIANDSRWVKLLSDADVPRNKMFI